MTTFIVIVILLALVFDYINGFHDAANSVATIVSTRVLSPRVAVIWAAFFNFAAFAVVKAKVAGNIAKGVAPTALTQNVILAALIGAIIWNLLTWFWGLPSSSSHALMGAFAGAALTNVPRLSILNAQVFRETFLFIVLAPLLGAVLGFALTKVIRASLANAKPATVDRVFRRGQLLSAALYSLGHGGNDSQKTMGIIMALLVSANLAQRGDAPPMWVALACYTAMGLGTLSGGWRIVKTMGMKITKLKPPGGFAAETAGALTLALATFRGVPVSTTHTITGAIVGVGTGEGKLTAVRWGVAGRIVWAWIFTIPAAGIMAAISYAVVRAITGRP
jgi:PiT family inorganic phosphate transporter